MRNNRVDLKLTKDWGRKKKGQIFKNLNRAYARAVQDVEKAGKIVDRKAVTPASNKMDKEPLDNK